MALEPVVTVAAPYTVSLLSSQREPSIDLLEAFVEHWKGITHYYIGSTGGARSPLAKGAPQVVGRKVWAVTMPGRDSCGLERVTRAAQGWRVGAGPTLTFRICVR